MPSAIEKVSLKDLCRKGQISQNCKALSDLHKNQFPSHSPQSSLCPKMRTEQGLPAGALILCTSLSSQKENQVGFTKLTKLGLLLPAPPLTGDSPGTTSVRQRLTHRVPCNRSLARTIHLSPIQLPDVTVIVPRVTAGNLLCPRHL